MWLSDVMCFIILRCYKSAFLCCFFCVYACKHLYIYVKLLMKYLWKSYLPGSDIWSSIFFLFLPLSLFSLGWKSNLHFYLMIQCKLEVITSNLNKCIEKSTWVFFLSLVWLVTSFSVWPREGHNSKNSQPNSNSI